MFALYVCVVGVVDVFVVYICVGVWCLLCECVSLSCGFGCGVSVCVW